MQQEPRYGHVNCDEVEQVIKADEAALAVAPQGSADHMVAVNNLARSLFSRHQCTESEQDLDLAIDHLRTAVRETPPQAPDRHVVLADLATALDIRSDLRGDPGAEDLEEAMALEVQVIAMFPPGSPHAALATGNLGQSLFHRYTRTSDPDDLDESVRLLTEAVAGLPKHLPEWVGIAHGLATVLNTRHQHTGHDADDLDRAIELFEGLLTQKPQSADPDVFVSRVRSGLAQALSARYVRESHEADLTRADELQQAAMRPGGRDHPVATSAALDQEAFNLMAQARRTGRHEDLERAIEAQEAALAMLPPANFRRSPLFTNLSSCWHNRFLWTRDEGDLDRAIAAAEQAGALPVPVGQQAVTLTMYGQCLLSRYELHRRPDDLDAALRDVERAAQLIQKGSINRPATLAVLARCLLLRYQATRHEPDLARALALTEQQASAGTGNAINRTATMLQAAQALASRFLAQRDDDDLRRATATFRAACREGREANPAGMFEAAKEWAEFAELAGAWLEAGEAYQHGLDALQLLTRVQLLRDNKEIPLRQARGMAARAAFALARSGRAQEAVAALETGRTVLLSEVLERDRADLEHLETLGRADLLRRYRDAADEVARLEQVAYLQGATPTPVSSAGAAASDETVRGARDQLQHVIEVIRSVPGYEAFLLPPTFADIAALAKRQPLVYLAAAKAGGLALVVAPVVPGHVTVHWLPKLTSAALDQRIRSLEVAKRRAATPRGQRAEWRTRLGATLGWLWDAALGEVVKALEAAADGVTLIPVGPLGLLPLHAARTLDRSKRGGWRYVLDHLAVSYAPSARTLAVAHRQATTAGQDSLLAVAEPRPSTLPPLRAATLEIHAASKHFGTRATLLTAENATREKVLDALPRYAVQHFACHGRTDPVRPLDSALFLAADQPLTLRDILTTRLAEVRLVVLSACETALPDQELPDEVIGFTTGMLQAGAAGVIGSLWQVPDVGSMALMARFYQLWRQGRDVAEAIRQAQRWVRDTTNAQKLATFPGLAAIFPKQPLPAADRADWEQERAHEHPAAWAAFVYVGA